MLNSLISDSPGADISLKHGWLLPELLDLDQRYWKRYSNWQITVETDSIPASTQIDFLNKGDDRYSAGMTAILNALNAIPFYKNSLHPVNCIPFFCHWLLFALGHPIFVIAPDESSGCSGASQRLKQAFDLESLIANPSDYLGTILAQVKHGQRTIKFYPTFQPVAKLMATTGAQSLQRIVADPPYHGYDPCLGTGRLALEMSNSCRSLIGWERDRELMLVSLTNFMLYAPDFALPIPQLGGDLILGDSLSGQGVSFVRNLPYRDWAVDQFIES